MIELLSRLFVKNRKNIEDPLVRRAYGVMVSVVGIVINLLLSVGKLVVGLLFGSISVTADAVNNLSDAGSSLISLICFRISAKPADRDHPFGHARIEYVASMTVAFLVLFIGCELLGSSASTLYHSIFLPETVTAVRFSWLTVGVLSVSVLGKLFLALLNYKIGKRIRSGVMRAAMADSLSDVLSTMAVLIATLVAGFVELPFSLDGAIGVVVSFLILVAGGKILIETKDSILGEAPPKETVEAIHDLVMSDPVVLGVHDLSVHQYGAGSVIASLHAEVDGSGDIFAAHDAIDNIERALWDKLHIRATLHLDPVVVGDPVVDALREETVAVVATVEPSVTVHDFRVVKGHTHTNLIFDIAVPFEVKRSDKDLTEAIAKEIGARHENHYTVIQVDRI
ncbi:MAG: cation transporter [Clostridia bacterium]|nr:cation transporter [Clostridia bacterium]